MSFKTVISAAAAACFTLSSAALAEGIMIIDPYARVASPMAKAGAAFMEIQNHGPADHLVSVHSTIAKRTELHTHKENDQGVMQMLHIEKGFEIPMHGSISLERGGKHVMFMGLTERLEEGDSVTLTLMFENAGEMVIEVPVDLNRGGAHAGHGEDHGHGHSHGHGDGHGDGDSHAHGKDHDHGKEKHSH